MNYYEILGLDKNAKSSEIKSAYRKLSMIHHPDKGGDSEKFKKINEAYQVLGDSEKKKMYDMQQNNPFMKMDPNNMGGMDGIFNMFLEEGIHLCKRIVDLKIWEISLRILKYFEMGIQ